MNKKTSRHADSHRVSRKKYAISKESWPAKRKCQAVLAKKSEKYDAEY